MRTITRILAGTLLTFAAATTASAQVPNFAGTWEMNPAKSNFGQIPAPTKNTMTVEQSAQTIKVTQVVSTPQGDVTLNQEFSLEGKPTTGAGFGGATTITTAMLDGTGLATKT